MQTNYANKVLHSEDQYECKQPTQSAAKICDECYCENEFGHLFVEDLCPRCRNLLASQSEVKPVR